MEISGKSPAPTDEANSVLAEYLELFDCLGYRYKYFMAPNAELEWFGVLHVRSPLRIHEFLLEKFGGKRCHVNFDKAVSCDATEMKRTEAMMRVRHLPSHDADLVHPRNVVPQLTSLKSRAESDVEGADVEMDTTPSVDVATSSNRTRTSSEAAESSDESDEYNIRRCKRMKYSAAQMSPFTYLRRLPNKKPQPTAASSDEDSSDDDTESVKKNSRQLINTNEYSQLRYLEAIGKILKGNSRQMDGGVAGRPVRIRIGYRKHLANDTTQFALIIYERHDQKSRPIRGRRMLDFTKCLEDDDEPQEGNDCNEYDCIEAQPAMIRSNESGEAREIVATVETPTTAEIATALEEAAFTIQPQIQRTPTKATPIPPGTPKRRPRSTQQLNMSGVVPLYMTPTPTPMKRSNARLGTTPKLNAARSLRL